MNEVVAQLFLALPELLLLVMACMALVLDVCLPTSKRIWTYYVVLGTLVLVFVATLPTFLKMTQPIILFSNHYVVDRLAILSKLFMYFFSFFAFLYARTYLEARQIISNEYYLLGLFAVLGMSIMASAYSLLTIYLGLELLSLTLYAMVAMNKESNVAIEAAMKYFVLGSLASGLLLYGISILYGVTGSVQLNGITQVLQSQQDILSNLMPIVALIFILSGLIFKFGAVPFHMWVPDVYQGAATPTTLFIASAPKVAAFVIMLRILAQAMPSLHHSWDQVLMAVSILSMFFGNILAIAQTNLKRMLAYSSIAHIGYTLLGILAGPVAVSGYAAALFYIVTYVLVAVGAFAVITLMSHDGIEFDRLEDYRGLNARNPWLAFMMLLLLFSMAGVPPTVGFIAKLGLLEALVQAHLVWLAVLALVFALIGAYYYLRVVMLMYFEEPVESVENVSIKLSPAMQTAISLNGAAALLLGLLPSFLIDICRMAITL